MSAISDLILLDAIRKHLISLSVCPCACRLRPLSGRLVVWFSPGCGGYELLLSSDSSCSVGSSSLVGGVCCGSVFGRGIVCSHPTNPPVWVLLSSVVVACVCLFPSWGGVLASSGEAEGEVG